MTAATVEEQRQRYARELAQHTLKQFQNVKREMGESTRSPSPRDNAIRRNGVENADDLSEGVDKLKLSRGGSRKSDGPKQRKNPSIVSRWFQ
ncbi:hypothetical protein CYLTODRAFT_490492 [Cylindrobasidium torrendii FP15055 ss-10]|uniref:Uncharacterized protein n=1 Tax=Cylindrobasidium torrendii FP15055 ss-10 TaxID=1314674 RepID=A0A0D7BAM4_9AGAR|nr:hypothetical protein CYLTODRAFT_490492 [Cylindrobasidium torrendii FP15055 ss-10]